MSTHFCKYCEYETNRKNNLDRHCIRKHSKELIQELQNSNSGQNVHLLSRNVHFSDPNVHFSSRNVHSDSQIVHFKFSCDRCNKDFQSNSKLIRHKSSCKGPLHKNECIFCHKVYSSRQSLYNHSKKCTGFLSTSTSNKEDDNPDIIRTREKNTQVPIQVPIQVSKSGQPPVNLQVNHVSNCGQVQNAQTIHNNTTINILTFPESIENEEFEFKTSHITKKHLQRITRNIRPEISFSKFAVLTLEQPENRMIRKTGPNVNYSMVHVGNGIWELVIDEYIYPTIIHFLTCGALKIIEDNPELKNLIEPFRSFVDHINTDNESTRYKSVEANVKLLVINLTKRKDVL